MLDIKWIRENQEEFDRLLVKRGSEKISEKIVRLDYDRRQTTTLIQQLQQSRKEKSRLMAMIQNKNSTEFEESRRDAEHINEKLQELSKSISDFNELDAILERLPNLPDPSVPEGLDESSNVLIKTHGEPVAIENAKEHFDIGESLEMMDFEQTAKISGSRFVTLSSDLARLERALTNFMLDIHTKEFGFTEVSPPYLVRPIAMYNTGQLPKLADDSFVTTSDYRLIPTSEVSLTNMVADRIIAREKLPIRMVAYSPCFRSEAGSHGRDTRGMFRVHQFSKVELVSIAAQDESEVEHQLMLSAAEEVLKRLELPYRVMLLCAGDMGFSSRKTYDIEVWLPGQNRYREISSCSNCGDFQARRMKARYKEIGANETTFVHTLNASALAVGRTIVAILENYQNPDGSITVPEALRNYMGGTSVIQVNKNEIGSSIFK